MGLQTLNGIVVNRYDGFSMDFGHELTFVTTLNAEILLHVDSNERLKEIINSGLVTLDGYWTMVAMRRKYPELTGVKKISGSNLIYDVVKSCAAQGKKVLLLGAEASANRQAVETLKQLNQYEDIYGFSPAFSPYPFSETFLRSVEAICLTVRPDVIITAFGVPKQEYWAEENRAFLEACGVKYVMFFGGAIDMVAGKFKHAPKWVQNCGLESPFRLMQNPKRFKRELKKLRIVPKIIFNKL